MTILEHIRRLLHHPCTPENVRPLGVQQKNAPRTPGCRCAHKGVDSGGLAPEGGIVSVRIRRLRFNSGILSLADFRRADRDTANSERTNLIMEIYECAFTSKHTAVPIATFPAARRPSWNTCLRLIDRKSTRLNSSHLVISYA